MNLLILAVQVLPSLRKNTVSELNFLCALRNDIMQIQQEWKEGNVLAATDFSNL